MLLKTSKFRRILMYIIGIHWSCTGLIFLLFSLILLKLKDTSQFSVPSRIVFATTGVLALLMGVCILLTLRKKLLIPKLYPVVKYGIFVLSISGTVFVFLGTGFPHYSGKILISFLVWIGAGIVFYLYRKEVHPGVVAPA